MRLLTKNKKDGPQNKVKLIYDHEQFKQVLKIATEEYGTPSEHEYKEDIHYKFHYNNITVLYMYKINNNTTVYTEYNDLLSKTVKDKMLN